MTPYQRKVIEDPNTRVAAYESLLDLFTLISFILIFAAFIYVSQSSAGVASAAAVVSGEAAKSGGTPQGIPKDVLLLVLFREDSKDRLTIIDGTTGVTTPMILTTQTTEGVLTSLSPSFARAAKINIAINEEKEPVNPAIVLTIQRWLASHSHNKYNFYFVGSK
jgi:hypothetical protein